jgi:hypothetical protein
MLFGFFISPYVIGGTITVITGWHHYGDHKVASLRRSRGGAIAAITEWHYSTAH